MQVLGTLLALSDALLTVDVLVLVVRRLHLHLHLHLHLLRV